ncbi:MAG: hypothetical protein IJ838_00125 [Paludibacteraceae bacterium]|nr:hypothetical protein [Paludibacteraceae bacterium]
MLPRVKIDFANGALGSVSPSADCVVGMVVTGTEVVGDGKLKASTAYILKKLDDLTTLGVTEANNAFLYKQVKEFYAQAGDGQELWLMAVPATVKPSDTLDRTNAYARKLIQVANGRIRALAVAYEPAAGYTASLENGLDSDVILAATNGQSLAEWATTQLYAPLFVVIAARGYKKANLTSLPDLTTMSFNRVGLLIGDTVSGSEGAAIGLLAGRIAECPVQRHIGRVKDGALSVARVYIDDEDPSTADVETLHDKGFITFRCFTGKSGYFFTDDSLACGVSDDYRSIARRRTIDKAYRIAYVTMLENVNDEIPITNEGYLVPSVVKSWEAEMVAAIVNQMTAQGELAADPDDTADMGVQCHINPEQRIASTSRIAVQLKVKPYGYSKYIDVELGFTTINSED